MRRKIQFALWVDYLINEQKPETVEVEFEWDGAGDVMKSALAGLEQEMNSREGIVDYSVSDWYWMDRKR